MFCSNCGKEVKNNMDFCLNCGCASNNSQKGKDGNTGCLKGCLITIVALSFVFTAFLILFCFLGLIYENSQISPETVENSSGFYKIVYDE